MDCSDDSDEELCTVVEVSDDYRSGDPPKLSNGINNITTTINILRFDNIELDGTMELTINIEMTWRDDKLTFLNIMDQGSVNVTNTKDVSSYKQSKLWLPLDRIVHENAVIGQILSGTNAFVRVAANTEAKDPDPKNPNEGNVST